MKFIRNYILYTIFVMQCMLLYISMSFCFPDIPNFFVFTKTFTGDIDVSFKHNSSKILKQTFGYGILLIGIISLLPTPQWASTKVHTEKIWYLLFFLNSLLALVAILFTQQFELITFPIGILVLSIGFKKATKKIFV